ncbi:zinc finger protein RFP-like [Oreochromis aureus]|uniref:zinc finger protein RFP-like n=1 Tax=Oreochromis aureus TaxID=47969 RepID=UPI001954B090|nr:zinc finger protein RFP-like [Oreochromis aureus]
MFKTRPELHVNTFISEVVAQFKCEVQQKASSSSSEQQAAKPGEVPCDICTGTRLKALKSCLVCQESYCQTHLEPHLTKKGLKKHQLIEAVENLEGRMCKKHDKPLELFCKNDQTCVCVLCSVLDHKNHEFVPLREEYEGKKAELEKTEVEIQQMIQKRRLKIQQVKESELIKEIEDKQETTEKQAEGLIKDLEQEISELKKRSSEDWTEVSIRPPSYEGTVVRAVDQLEETLRKLMKKKLPEATELKKVQQYAVDVTLDPNTAYPYLILSDDGKQVYHSDVKKKLPDNPERFTRYCNILGKQSFSSGRFYFEVQVKGKTKWDLGVARESINRKGKGVCGL